MKTKFYIGQNIYVLYKEGGAFPRYEVKGTKIVGVKQEIDYGIVANDNTIEVRYKLLNMPDKWILDDVLYDDYTTAKSMCDKLNYIDKAYLKAQKASEIKNG